MPLLNPCVSLLGRRLILLFLLTLTAGSSAAQCAERDIEVRFTPEVRSQPFTGRVYVFFSQLRDEPRRGPDWFHPEQFIAMDVKDWKPGDPLLFSNETSEGILAYPVPFQKMSIEGFTAQAVARFNPYEREVGRGPGNGFGPAVRIDSMKTPLPAGARINLSIDQVVKESPFPESRWCKLFRIRSAKLSAFHGRDIYLQGAVTLPESYERDTTRRYPVIYAIPGFGGTHRHGLTDGPVRETNSSGVEFLRVMLDPSCPLGHHVFADSENNGPVGTAFVEEFLPEFDRQFRTVADPRARFLTGHSSGGWSSLWLQVTYPNSFGGTWSTSPDPVDFRDFQLINIYAPGVNMYVDSKGQTRPLARARGQVLLTFKGFGDMEWVVGPGGQLHSFEAVFSPRGNDGKPQLLWNRKTGAIDSNVAKAWEKYDIRLVLERNWKTLGPKLAGKIQVDMGDEDTFYLDGAAVLLKQSLAKLGSDAQIEMHPGADHGSILTSALLQRIGNQMAGKFRSSFPDHVKPKELKPKSAPKIP